ncbi:MAG TPA: hypothetical protein PKM41_11900 [Deltaproteobacteria bacterium]|jgi:hypothetical protein|nr:hypothetical protein [Deltaproteobacteria bacterium]HOI07817.1 hypothetical protein [Deltaproteobacteria bacterium]
MDNDVRGLSDIKVDQKNLYKEEVFTDLRIATIRQLTPVLPDGRRDEGREVLFFGQTQMMTPGGALPIQFEIEAKDLQQAMEKFPEAVQRGVNELVESAREAQRQAESRIVTPTPPGSKIVLP